MSINGDYKSRPIASDKKVFESRPMTVWKEDCHVSGKLLPEGIQEIPSTLRLRSWRLSTRRLHFSPATDLDQDPDSQADYYRLHQRWQSTLRADRGGSALLLETWRNWVEVGLRIAKNGMWSPSEVGTTWGRQRKLSKYIVWRPELCIRRSKQNLQ
jgi:hypothetical protein